MSRCRGTDDGTRSTETNQGVQTEFEKGDLLLIESGEAHEIVNDSGDPLVTLNIHAPPAY